MHHQPLAALAAGRAAVLGLRDMGVLVMDADARILSAALHWLVNHYEINSQDPDLRNAVIARVEQVLKHREPTTADMERLREIYPFTPVEIDDE